MKISCFSQTTLENNKNDSIVTITSEQLKCANLIFAEHEKLLIENDLLYEQINNYEEEIAIMEFQDSLRIDEINNYNQLTDVYKLQISNLNKNLNKKDKLITGLKIGCFTVSIGLVLLLILK